MQCKVIGIDLAKQSMQVCLLGMDQKVLSNKKVSRGKLMLELSKIDPDVPIAMEACGTSHYWGRRFKEFGREVVLLPAQHVKPLVGHQKNDANDAIAICEAFQRPRIHPVSLKTVEQQDIQALRRIRKRHVDNRTALGITKNGNRELRTLLIHGARAVVYRYKSKDNALGRWLAALITRRGVHKAIVALANKLARITWAVLRYQQPFAMNRAFG